MSNMHSDDVKRLLHLMEGELRRIGAPPMRDDRAFLKFQIEQGEKLCSLEDHFRLKLVAHARGEAIFRRFMTERADVSVLTARPYFRARQELFAMEIGPAINVMDVAGVQKHRINYRFVRWVLANFKLRREFTVLAERIAKLRRDMALLVLPLALSKVGVFWRRTPRSHHSYLDLLNEAVLGTLAAIDKFVPPFTRTFRAVVWGRISTFLIDAYSATPTHFYPGDRRMLYRANKLARQVDGQGLDALDYDGLVERIRRDNPGETILTTPEELASMMGAASSVSLDTGPAAVGRRVRALVSTDLSPEDEAERTEAVGKVMDLASIATCRERKLLCLMGMLSTLTGPVPVVPSRT